MNGFVVGSDGVAQDYDEWRVQDYDDPSQDETLSASEFAGIPTPLAWSVPEDYDEEEPRHRRWPYAVFAAAATALGSVISAAVILLPAPHDPTPPTPPTSIAPPTPVAETVPPTTTATVTVSAEPSTVTVSPPPPPVPPPPVVQSSGCDSYSLRQLRTQVRADDIVLTAGSQNMWVPQISSKRPGVFDDGKTWDCAAIWQEHQRLRDRYDAKLVWSGDWPRVYHSRDDYWVTVAPWLYPSAAGAQAWCDSHGRDADHCFPTLIPVG
jgi:serine/threonine-protein kinase